MTARNFSPANLPNVVAKLAALRAGSGLMRVMCVGDSLTFGWGSQTINPNDCKTYSWPNLLAAQWGAATGIKTICEGEFGNGNGVFNTNYDPRLINSGGWGGNPSFLSIGGQPFQGPASSSGIKYTPNAGVDTFALKYVEFPTTGEFNVGVNSNTPTLVNTANPTIQVGHVTVNATIGPVPGGNTLELSNPSGASVNIFGWEAWDSTVPCIAFSNASYSSSSTADWVAPGQGQIAFSGANVLASVAPDLTIMCLAINDMVESVPVATYTANLNTLIAAAKAGGGDIILVTPNHNSSPDSSIQPYINAIYSVAGTTIPVVDLWVSEGSYHNQQANGYMYDVAHMVPMGYQRAWADNIAAALAAF